MKSFPVTLFFDFFMESSAYRHLKTEIKKNYNYGNKKIKKS